MGIFDRIFGSGASDDHQQPDVRFGRYSDSYKTNEQYDAWDSALEKFDQKDYVAAYKDFFYYLRDEQENNVWWEEKEEILHFEILQGSKKITGMVDQSKIRVEAKVVKVNELNVALLKQLVTRNFNLEYSRFALNEENSVVIVFDSFLLDGSPYKFYYALRELATNADKQDDLLLDEFEGLSPIQSNHLTNIPAQEKEAKYHFIQIKIKKALALLDEAGENANQFSGGLTYLLLDLVYRLDFLIKPEGFMMETLERINRQYFTNDKKTTEEKNAMIRKELEALIARPKEDFFKEMYRVRATFGITKPISPQRIRGIIDGELSHMNWYKENGRQAIALAIPGYIIGNCLFNYAVPKVILDLFKMYYKIMEPKYFEKLGFKQNLYNHKTDRFNAKQVKKKIKMVVQENRAQYFELNPDLGILNFDSGVDFAKSYLMMVRDMELTPKYQND